MLHGLRNFSSQFSDTLRVINVKMLRTQSPSEVDWRLYQVRKSIRKNIATKNLLKSKNKLCSKMKVKTE